MKRVLSFVFASFALGLAGCKDPGNAGDSATTSLVKPGSDTVVKSVRAFAPSDAVAGTNDEYYVVTFTFTNDQGMALAPRIDHFVLADRDNRRYFGVDAGNVSLVGIGNYGGVLKVGDSHDYTVGFRVPHDTTGTLIYDNSF